MVEPIRVHRSGPDGVVANVVLARPSVRNAFNALLLEALSTVFTALSTEGPDRLRAVVLSGEGPVFSAGADIEWMLRASQLDVEANADEAESMASLFELIDQTPVPVIARVHGAAIGGGLGLCAVADIVIAEAATQLGLTEVRLGLIPAVIAPFVIAKVGEGQARAIICQGSRFGADDGRRIGIIHRVCSGEEELDAAVQATVDDVLRNGPVATRAAKMLVRELRDVPRSKRLPLVARRIAAIRVSDEAREGLGAFLDRRTPTWVVRSEDQG